MKEFIRISLFLLFIIGLIITFYLWPLLSILLIGGLLVLLFLYDYFQKKHSILRNFPVLGHMRFLLESIGPEIHQYFIESDTDGKPIDKNHRSYIYERAKKASETHPFGTELDITRENYEWMAHSIYPAKKLESFPIRQKSTLNYKIHL